LQVIAKIKNIHKKMEEPLIAEWALDRLLEKKDWASDKDEFEKTLFNDLTIRHLIQEEHPDVLSGLFARVSTERFRNTISMIADRWPQWKGIIALHSAACLAEFVPEKAEELFCSYFRSPSPFQDPDKAIGIIDVLLHRKDDRWRSLSTEVVALVHSSDDPDVDKMFLPDAVGLAWAHNLPEAKDLLIRLMTFFWNEEYFEDHVFSVYAELTKGQPFLSSITDLHSGAVKEGFRSLAPHFHEKAPLDELDRLARSIKKNRLRKALELLEEVSRSDQRGLASMVLSALRSCENKMEKSRKLMLSHFALAIVAACCLRDDISWSDLSLEESLRIASSSLVSLPLYPELLAHLRQFPKDEVISRIEDRFSRVEGAVGECNLVRIMGDLGWPEFAPRLFDCLSLDKTIFLCETSFLALTKIGPAVEKMLVDRLGEANRWQKLYTMTILGRWGGSVAVDVLLDSFPDMRANMVVPWCTIALAVPDSRLIETLKPELDRKNPEVDAAFFCLCTLLDYDHPQLESIKERVLEERRREEARLSAELDEYLFNDSLHLELQCSSCGAIHKYEVESIFVDPEDSTEKPFIAEDLNCSSCGDLADFEPTDSGMKEIAAELVKVMMAMEMGEEFESPLQFMTPIILSGRKVSFRGALDIYRKAVEQNPDSASDLLGLANCYATVKRIRQAEDCFRKCLEIEAACVEAAWMLASIWTERGDIRGAFDVLHESLQHKEHWRFYHLTDMTPKEYTEHFARFYNSLRDELRLKYPPALDPFFYSGEKKKRKESHKRIGRNDPCPCGSGKKYKKCCLLNQ
jgi:tetratricopeptide (TPR) repeat protein